MEAAEAVDTVDSVVGGAYVARACAAGGCGVCAYVVVVKVQEC